MLPKSSSFCLEGKLKICADGTCAPSGWNQNRVYGESSPLSTASMYSVSIRNLGRPLRKLYNLVAVPNTTRTANRRQLIPVHSGHEFYVKVEDNIELAGC